MTLDERLDAARQDYRHLGEGPFAGAGPRTAPVVGRRGSWALSVAAAVVLVALVAALVWWSTDDRSPVVVDTGTTVTVPAPETPPANGDFQPLAPDGAVQLEPAGPFTDGQRVELSVPSGFSEDWMNEWPLMCSTVSTPGGPSTSCDHVDRLDAEGGYGGVSVTGERDTRAVVLPRTVFTTVGYRDCAEPSVSCHVVVRRSDGTPSASERLEFEGPAPDRSDRPALAVSAGDLPGRFVITPSGLVPNDAWVEQAEASSADATVPAFSVQVCAFGDGEPALDPTGAPWVSAASQWWPRRGLGSNCDALEPLIGAIDPADPDRPFTVDVSRELYGYAGWSDCRVSACYVSVAPAWPSAGGLTYDLEGTTAALLPRDLAMPVDARPALTLLEAGPYRQDQEITVGVAGLPVDAPLLIGVCRLESPWACSYPTDQGAGAAPGTHRLRLTPSLEGCGLEQCFLAVSSGGEGLRPPATVRLPVDEASTTPGSG